MLAVREWNCGTGAGMFSRPIIFAAACAGFALAAGCGGSGDRASAAGDGGTPSAGPSTPASPGARTASPGSPGPRDQAAACGTVTLHAKLTLGGAAAGNRYALLVLTDTGAAPCRTYGYPGLKLTGTGNPPTKAVRVTETGKPVHLTLKPGASAWTRLHWGAAPGAGDHQTGACQPTPAHLWITPPDQRDHLTVKWSFGPVCEHGTIYVSPLHPGDHDPGAS